MKRRNRAVFLWLFGIAACWPLSGTDLCGGEPAQALGFVDFCFEAPPERSLATEYYFEQGGQERLIVKFYHPKEDIENPTADLKDFRFFQAEYFVGDWFVLTDEGDGFEPSHPNHRSEMKRDYSTRYPPFFLSKEEGVDIDERPNSRRFIKKLGIVPMPDFPAEVLAMFRRAGKG